MKHKTCPACDHHLAEGFRYCPRCGAWQGRGSRRLLDWVHDPRLLAFFGILAGVELFVIVSLSREIKPAGASLQVMPPTWTYSQPAPTADAQLLAIAERYNCPCGSCSGDSVAACDCTHPNGAVEIKAWFAQLLLEGKSPEKIDQLMVNRFGEWVKRP